MISMLNEPYMEDLRDAAVTMKEEDRAKKVMALNEDRKKINFSNPNGKLDSRSKMEEGLAIVFANR